jgi:hypothetical protein
MRRGFYYVGVFYRNGSLSCLGQRACDGYALIYFDRYGLLGHPAVLVL